MQKLWFKAKEYGYGWYPATWQGWVVLAAYVGVLGLLYYFCFGKLFGSAEKNPSGIEKSVIIFVVGMFISTTLLIVIAYKTGEKANQFPRHKPPADARGGEGV